MKKIYAIFALLTLCSITFTSCKPKEKVEISSSAPTETTTAAAPTEPATKEPETTAPPLESSEAAFEEGGIKIKYPQLTGLGNDTLEVKINTMIKDAAISAIPGYEIDSEKDTAAIDYKVKSLNKKMLVVVFTGKAIAEGSKTTTPLEYYLTLDLNTGKTIRLTNYIDPTSLGEILISGSNYQVISDDSNLRTKIKNYFAGISIETYQELFTNADFSGDSSDPFPSVFSYDDSGAIVFTIPVPKDLGSYATLSFAPVTK